MLTSVHGKHIMLYSEEDYDLICLLHSGWSPIKSGYAVFNNTKEYVHLAIAKRKGIDSILVNHIDSNRLNNQRNNLEPSDHSYNNLAINRKSRPVDKTEVLIDAEDFEIFHNFGWHIDGGYVCLNRGLYKNVYLHRLIALRAKKIDSLDDSRDIDHEDQNPFNNHRYNLRPLTRSQNAANSLIARGICGYYGVKVNGKKYRASIGPKSIGTFECAQEAAIAFDKAAIEAYGPTYKYLNFNMENYA